MRHMILAAIVAAATLFGAHSRARAHCDGLDGPVVADARAALRAGRVNGVLKWISAEQEAEVRSAFERALEVRALGEPARSLADTYFFETLVRLHRAGEGAPYTGLKPAGSAVEPGVEAADQALRRGSVDGLAKTVARRIEGEVRRRFARVVELRKHAERSPEDGRKYVAAYVDYVHYLRGLHLVVGGEGERHAH